MLSVDQFLERLQREVPGAVVLFGDEPLQLGECLDALRAAARRAGCEERTVFEAAREFDWGELGASSDSLSLFASRRLFEVRVRTRPGADGAAAVARHVATGSDDVLVLSCPEVDGKTRGTAWFRKLEATALCVGVEVVTPSALPGWLAKRFARHGLRASDEACELLAERTEGNLLAATQEVDKLVLLLAGERVEAEDIALAAGDSARFASFALVEAALEGDQPRVVRVIRGLRAEGVELPPLLGTVTWMLRNLHGVAMLVAGGEPVGEALRRGQFGPLRRRAAAVRALLARRDRHALEALLRRAHAVDRAVKGRSSDEPWAAMQRLCLALAGPELLD